MALAMRGRKVDSTASQVPKVDAEESYLLMNGRCEGRTCCRLPVNPVLAAVLKHQLLCEVQIKFALLPDRRGTS